MSCSARRLRCDQLLPEPAARHQVRPGGRSLREKPDFARWSRTFRSRSRSCQKLTPDEPQELQPGGARPDLRAAHRRARYPTARSTATLIFPQGEDGRPPARRDRRRAAGLRGRAEAAPASRTSGRTLWKGKVFYRKDRMLRNRIEDLTLLKPLIEGDLSTIQKISGRRQGPVAALPGEALLRAEPARQPARVDHHRLLLHRRDRRATARSRTSSPAATGLRCATRSAWCAPGSISAARTPARCSC